MTTDFRKILDLEAIDLNLFRGRTDYTDVPRIFGGEVASQALVAAARTVPLDRGVHSLHAYFLRPGDPALPVLYRVDRIRDGRSFTTRRVTAIQNGEAIFNLAASFHLAETGLAHQVPVLRGPSPEDLPTAETVIADADVRTQAWYASVRARFPVELRFPEPPPRVASLRGEARPPRQGAWVRAAQPLPDDPLAHACAITYVSDLFLLTTALPPHRVVIDDPGVQLASLDHAVWFHAPFRADEWMYYDMSGTWAGGGRALCQGQIFAQEGTLIASVVQEGLVRVGKREQPAPSCENVDACEQAPARATRAST